MGWPTSNDYLDAMLHPARRFSKPELKRGQPALGPDGKPFVHAGEYLDVYEFRGVGGVDRWAIGCFVQQPRGQGLRHQLINDHLQKQPCASIVETEYLDQGIVIRGRWHPITRSLWFDGLPLRNHVKDIVDQPMQLNALASAWIKLAQYLRKAGIAHGNLGCDTVLVGPGPALRLVDYTALFVPALAETPPEEMGNAAFQHPLRATLKTYDADVDRFGFLVIFTALRALAVGGSALLQRFDDGSNLLFRANDWSEPATSGLLRTLWHSPDPGVRSLVGHVLLASQGNIGDVPELEQVADAPELNSAAIQRINTLLGETENAATLDTGGVDFDLPVEDDAVEDFNLIVSDEPKPETAVPPPPPVALELDPNIRIFELDAWMPEQIAVIKLQGFVRDTGGQTVLSVPGHIRVHMMDDQVKPVGPGLLAWLGLVQPPPPPPPVLAVIDLFLAHKPTQGRPMIGITVQVTPGSPHPGPHWQAYCERIFCDLRSFLVGYQ